MRQYQSCRAMMMALMMTGASARPTTPPENADGRFSAGRYESGDRATRCREKRHRRRAPADSILTTTARSMRTPRWAAPAGLAADAMREFLRCRARRAAQSCRREPHCRAMRCQQPGIRQSPAALSTPFRAMRALFLLSARRKDVSFPRASTCNARARAAGREKYISAQRRMRAARAARSYRALLGAARQMADVRETPLRGHENARDKIFQDRRFHIGARADRDIASHMPPAQDLVTQSFYLRAFAIAHDIFKISISFPYIYRASRRCQNVPHHAFLLYFAPHAATPLGAPLAHIRRRRRRPMLECRTPRLPRTMQAERPMLHFGQATAGYELPYLLA